MSGAAIEADRFQQWWATAQWEPLMASMAPRVRALLLANGADSDLADDITQETLVRCWRQTLIPDNPLAFAATVARNLLRDHAKSSRVRLQAGGVDTEVAMELLASTEEDPLEAIIAEADRMLLREALRQIPDKMRRPLILAAFHQRTSVQLAEQFGGRPEAMRMRLSRARQLLVKALTGEGLPKRRGPTPRWFAPAIDMTPPPPTTIEVVVTELPNHVTAVVVLHSIMGKKNIGTFCVTPAEWEGGVGHAIRTFNPAIAAPSTRV